MQRTPSERTERIKRLAVTLLVTFSCVFLCERLLCLKLFRNRIVHLRHREKRGSRCDTLDRFFGSARLDAASNGRFDDERNVNGRVVNEEPVLLLSMFAQRLAMIAQEHNRAP